MRTLNPHQLPVNLAVVPGPAGYLGWIVVAGLVSLVAVIRVLRQPAEAWRRRNWSKLAWVLAILYLAPIVGGWPVPVGAIAAIWRTRNRRSATTLGIHQVEGNPDWPLPWGTK